MISLLKIIKITCNEPPYRCIWFLNGDKLISDNAKAVLENPNNIKIVSIASLWEIAIKMSLNRLSLPKGFMHFLNLIEDNRFEILPISIEHTLTVAKLDFIHRDPFDRLLIAQCNTGNLTIVTKDDNIKRYDVSTIW